MVIARTSNVLRRITTLLIICCSSAVVLSPNTAAALPGSGTQEDPYRIESLADFDEFAADPNYWSGFTRLETDVNLAGRTYTTAVIAPDVNNSNGWFDGTAFTGVFDGNDHKIVNLTIDDGGTDNWYLGVFGWIAENGEVKNLGLEAGEVTGNRYVGGLVGCNSGLGGVSNCYSTCDVNGVSDVGGLVGRNIAGSISNCYSTADVIGDWDVGGLVGQNGLSIDPAMHWSWIYNCYSTGSVCGTGNNVGGLVGCNSGLGGVSNCYSTCDVNGVSDVGGLVGSSGGGSISNCYSTGDVSGEYYVGGLMGYNFHGIASNCYSTCDVNGVDVGGLVGVNVFFGDIERSFWDVETTGQPDMCGDQDEYATGCDPNCGKTTAEMQTRSTFTEAGWDFVEIWLINDGATYPVLRQEIRSDLNGDDGVNLLDFAIFADHWLEGKDD